MEKLSLVGRCFFAVALIASGLQQLVIRDFVRLVPKLPAWIPAPSAWACVVGVVLIAAGAAMFSNRSARLAAFTVAGLLLLSFFGQRVPEIIASPQLGFVWTNPAKVLALLGGAFVVAGWPASNSAGAGASWGGRNLLAAALLSIFLTMGGVQHFVYAAFVDTLVPAWIPPSQRFWTYFAGAALIAGGVGLLWPKTRFWAATLSGLMIFLWVLLLHIPRALVDLHQAGETSSTFEALALSGVCLLAAGSPLGRESR